MIKRTLYFGNPIYLSLRLNQLVAVKKTVVNEHKREIPIEDIGMVLLDHQQITITHGAIKALNANNVAIVSCDSKHMPSGIMLPMEGHTLQSRRYREQINVSLPLKKNLWQQTVKAKILNQMAVLQKLDKPYQRLQVLAARVTSGDVENAEGQAAAYYWQMMFGSDFLRRREGDPPNHLLNYGYAFIRSMVARALVSTGLIPSLGIHHKNQYNAYCLADDIMEPFRPFVDLIVHSLYQVHLKVDYIDKEIKTALMEVATVDTVYGKSHRPLMVGLSFTTASLYDCYIGKRKKIIYPELC